MELLLIMQDDYGKRIASLTYNLNDDKRLEAISVRFIGDSEPATIAERIIHLFHQYIEGQILFLITKFQKENSVSFKGLRYTTDHLGRVSGVDVQFNYEKVMRNKTGMLWSPRDGL